MMLFNLIKLLFHRRGEADVDYFMKVLFQKVDNNFSKFSWMELLLLSLYIFSI